MDMEQQIPPVCAVNRYKEGDVLLVILAGKLCLKNADEVRRQILDLMTGAVRTLHVHLNQLTLIDSGGLGMLVGLHCTAHKRKIELSFLSPTTTQWQLFELTRLLSVFNIPPDIEAEAICQRYATEANWLPFSQGGEFTEV